MPSGLRQPKHFVGERGVHAQAAECIEVPREVCELASAHVNSDCVEAAYRRSFREDWRVDLAQFGSQFLDRPLPRSRWTGRLTVYSDIAE